MVNLLAFAREIGVNTNRTRKQSWEKKKQPSLGINWRTMTATSAYDP